jgi:anti-anti-sigma regulatory factor
MHNVVIDLSNTKLVDHSVMNKLYDMQRDFKRAGLRLEITGLDDHQQLSNHELSARKRVLVKT